MDIINIFYMVSKSAINWLYLKDTHIVKTWQLNDDESKSGSYE